MEPSSSTPSLSSRNAAAYLHRQSASWYNLHIAPLNEQVSQAAQTSFGTTTGKIIGTAFKVIPIMIVIFILPQPAALVGFSISFVVTILEPNAFKEFPTLSRLCANGMGFYSALKAIQCSFFALDPLYLISMAIHLAIAYACFSFIKNVENKEHSIYQRKRARASFESPKSSPQPTRAHSRSNSVDRQAEVEQKASTALIPMAPRTPSSSSSLTPLPESPPSSDDDSSSASAASFNIQVSLTPTRPRSRSRASVTDAN